MTKTPAPMSSRCFFMPSKHRWGAGNKDIQRDAQGRVITHLTSGGRTSAVVLSIQKKPQPPRRQQKGSKMSNKTADGNSPELAATKKEPQGKPRVKLEKVPSSSKSNSSSIAQGTQTSRKRHARGADKAGVLSEKAITPRSEARPQRTSTKRIRSGN